MEKTEGKHHKTDTKPYPVHCFAVLNVNRCLVYYEENWFKSLKIIF